MWDAVLAVEREGGGGGGYCVQIKTLHPVLLTAGKTGPPDRPTDGHYKAAFFFFACAMRLSSRSNRALIFVLFDFTMIVYPYYPVKAALCTIDPRSPYFALYTPKYCRSQIF